MFLNNLKYAPSKKIFRTSVPAFSANEGPTSGRRQLGNAVCGNVRIKNSGSFPGVHREEVPPEGQSKAGQTEAEVVWSGAGLENSASVQELQNSGVS